MYEQWLKKTKKKTHTRIQILYDNKVNISIIQILNVVCMYDKNHIFDEGQILKEQK